MIAECLTEWRRLKPAATFSEQDNGDSTGETPGPESTERDILEFLPGKEDSGIVEVMNPPKKKPQAL
jgi:hypothetical protein